MKKIITYYSSKDKIINDKVSQNLNSNSLSVESLLIDEENLENNIKIMADNVKEYDLSIIISDNYMYYTVKLNKIKNIRCSQCLSYVEAKYTRDHNDSNLLSLGSNMLGVESILNICEIYCGKEFSKEEKHIRRVNKIELK